MSNVQLGHTQVIDPISFKSIPSGKIYIGEYGTLPNPANASTWKQAYFVNSDGTRTAASQPIRTNAAGFAVDGSGNIKTIQVDGGYSLLVQDQYGATKFSQACSAANSGAVLEFDAIAGFTGALDGSVCYFKGRDTVGDGGGGHLRFLAGSTATADGVTTYAVTGGRLVREGWSVFGVRPEWAGAKGDGLAFDTAAVVQALSLGVNVAGTPGAVYRMGAGITVNVGKQSFNGNGSTLDFSSLTGTDVAITFVNDSTLTPNDLRYPSAIKHSLNGFTILGPGKAGGGAAYNDNTIALKNYTPYSPVKDCLVYGFGEGLALYTESFIQIYDNVSILQCKIGVHSKFGGNNYGERIVFNGGQISNNKLAIKNACPTGVLQFIGCSIDYNQKTLEGSNSSATEMHGTWIEMNDAGAGNVHFELSGGSTYTQIGGRIQQNGTLGALAQAGLFNTSADSTATLSDVFMFNTKNTADVLDIGSGSVEIVRTKSYPVAYIPSNISPNGSNGKLVDGSFEFASVVDMWAITDDTVAITSRLTGSNIKLAQSADTAKVGSKSLKVTKVAGGAPGAFAVIVPSNGSSRNAYSSWYKKPAGVDTAGVIFVTTAYARYDGLNQHGVPVLSNLTGIDTMAIGGTTSLIDWTYISSSMAREIPSWANCFIVLFNCHQFQGVFYLDGFNISSM